MAATALYNNPLAQWPNTWSALFGSTSYGTIGGGNRIAGFQDPVAGASANVATMLSVYGGSSISDMIAKWSGGNNSSDYLGYVTGRSGVDPSATVSSVLGGSQGPGFLSAMANWEGGGGSMLSLDQWTQALANGFSATSGNVFGKGPTGSEIVPYTSPNQQTPGAYAGPGGTRDMQMFGATPFTPFSGAFDFIGKLTTRISVIVLGFVFVAVGLVMFGRTVQSAAIEALGPRQNVVRRRAVKAQGDTAEALADLAKAPRGPTGGGGGLPPAPTPPTPTKPPKPRAPRRRQHVVDAEKFAKIFARYSRPTVEKEAKETFADRVAPRPANPFKARRAQKEAANPLNRLVAKVEEIAASPKARQRKATRERSVLTEAAFKGRTAIQAAHDMTDALLEAATPRARQAAKQAREDRAAKRKKRSDNYYLKKFPEPTMPDDGDDFTGGRGWRTRSAQRKRAKAKAKEKDK